MEEDSHIEKFGIFLEDVLVSRKKALKNNSIDNTSKYTCPKCGNVNLEKFYASSSQQTWKMLCGRAGDCVFCNKCMDIVKFDLNIMS